MYQSQWVEPVLPMVSTLGPWGVASPQELTAVSAPTSSQYESSSVATYHPLWVPTTCVIRRVWWANGATTTGGATVEVGVYRSDGYLPTTKVISGSATQGTASQVQFVDVTDTTIVPGLYYIAITVSAATNTYLFNTTIGNTSLYPIRYLQEASAYPLPATATPVQRGSSSRAYLCGFATTASP